MESEFQFQEACEAMLRDQIERRGIHNRRLLAAMRSIPRHLFIPPHLHEQAYNDCPLPIGLGQTISQPFMVAVMTNLLQLRGDENVLEVGTGSGYQAAVLAQMAHTVHTIERHPALNQRARHVLAELGYGNVFVHLGDGSYGWPPAAPFQAILVTAAAPEIPLPLIDQLAENGSLVLPVGGRRRQKLERWRKWHENIFRETIFEVSFVPLRGELGWQEEDWEEYKPENR